MTLVTNKNNITDEPMEIPTKKRVSFSDYVEEFSDHYYDDSDDEQTKAKDDSEDETKEVKPTISTEKENTIFNFICVFFFQISKQEKPRKKKLTPAEQLEMIKKQDEELRQKELEFADSASEPQSAEQFDRRLLAEPHSSELWTKYVSLYLAVML